MSQAPPPAVVPPAAPSQQFPQSAQSVPIAQQPVSASPGTPSSHTPCDSQLGSAAPAASPGGGMQLSEQSGWA